MNYFPTLKLNDEEYIESLETKYINSKEVTGKLRIPVSSKKSAPGVIGFDIS